MSPWPQANTVLSPFHGLYSQWSRDFMWPQRSFVTWEPGRHYPHFLEKETGIPPPPSPIFFFFFNFKERLSSGWRICAHCSVCIISFTSPTPNPRPKGHHFRVITEEALWVRVGKKLALVHTARQGHTQH